MSYYAAMSLLCELSSTGDGWVGAQDAHACIERVRMLLGTNDRSSLGAERAAQLMEDVNAMYGPVMSGAVAEALSVGDIGRQVPWPRLTVTRAHFGCVVPLIALHTDGTLAVQTGTVRNGDSPAKRWPTQQRTESVSSSRLIGTPIELGQMLRECCIDRGLPLLALTGSGLFFFFFFALSRRLHALRVTRCRSSGT